MKPSAAVTILLSTAAFVSSCTGGCGENPNAQASASAATALPPLAPEKRTTSPEIAIANLNGRIKSSDRSLEMGQDKVGPRGWLIATLLDRSTSLGKVSDLGRVSTLETELATLAPKDGDILLKRAGALSAVHRFDDALVLIDDAQKAGQRKDVVDAKRAAIFLAQGKYEEACPIFEELSNARLLVHVPKTLFAVCIAQLGRIEEADRVFADAEANYEDVSPFALSWMWFERGSMWERAGDEAKAKTFYKGALERLPAYAHAAAHLAQLVPPAEAEAILKPVFEHGDDPELDAILGLAKEKAQAGSGKVHLDKAKARYEELLSKYPLAFADHAGWFFLEAVNDPARAADVARLNLKNRKSHEAYELALAALPAAGNAAEACEVADKALERKWVPPSLKELAAKAYEACGKPEQAAAARAK